VYAGGAIDRPLIYDRSGANLYAQRDGSECYKHDELHSGDAESGDDIQAHLRL
jgi:hypothetical protein